MKIEVVNNKVSLQIDGAFTSSELRTLIEKIAQARAEISDDPQSISNHPTDVQAVGGMAWWTEFKPDMGMTLFAYRHPGLGWIGVMLKPPDVAHLIGYLALQLNTAASHSMGPAGGNSPTPNIGSGGRLLH